MKQIGFALGIRTIRSFSVEDRLGAIIDEILFSKDSEFNEILFPQMRENHNTKVLFNPLTKNKFTVTPRDFIFEYSVTNDFKKEFEQYLNGFKSLIINKVFSNQNIRNINRYGFVIKTELNENDSFLNELSAVIKKHKGNDDSISLRFNVITKKPLKIDTIITEDYDNEIITYDRQNSASPLNFIVDYQKYFKPELNIIGDAEMSFDTFCQNSLTAFNEKYLGKK